MSARAKCSNGTASDTLELRCGIEQSGMCSMFDVCQLKAICPEASAEPCSIFAPHAGLLKSSCDHVGVLSPEGKGSERMFGLASPSCLDTDKGNSLNKTDRNVCSVIQFSSIFFYLLIRSYIPAKAAQNTGKAIGRRTYSVALAYITSAGPFRATLERGDDVEALSGLIWYYSQKRVLPHH